MRSSACVSSASRTGASGRLRLAEASLRLDIGAPFVGVAGRWIRRTLVRRQVGERRLNVVNDAGVADLDDPGRDGGGQVVDDVGRRAIRSDGPQDTQMDDGEEDRPSGLAVPGRSEDRARIRPVGLDE